jgi:cellobiose phosphorylase
MPGRWFRRAYFDDGTPGSAANAECQIDSVAQSWSVLSGAADEIARGWRWPSTGASCAATTL